jgi:hypothetical protein
MMDMHALNIVLRSVLALLAVWCVWYFGLREYFLDKMRQRFFEIRDKLFDYAAEGHIDFNHRAYGNLRLSLNGMLRFAHQMSLSRSLLSIVAQGFRPNPVAENLLKNHFAPMMTLPAEQKQRLMELHLEMIVTTIMYVSFRTPVLLLGIGMVYVFCKVTSTFSSVTKTCIDCLKPATDVLEAQALESDTNGRHRAIA